MKRIEFDTYLVAFALSVLVGLFVWGFSRPIDYTPVSEVETVAEVETAAAPEMFILKNLVVSPVQTLSALEIIK